MMNQPRHPEITVQLTGENGNAFVLLGLVQRALRRAGVPAEEVKRFIEEATAGDYNALLRVCCEWVEVR
jgi:hypothetical protein